MCNNVDADAILAMSTRNWFSAVLLLVLYFFLFLALTFGWVGLIWFDHHRRRHHRIIIIIIIIIAIAIFYFAASVFILTLLLSPGLAKK